MRGSPSTSASRLMLKVDCMGVRLYSVGQHLFGLDVLGQLDDDAHALPVGFVAQVGRALQIAIAHQLGDALDQAGLVDLVGQLGDDDAALAALHLLDVRLGLDGDAAAPGAVGRLDALLALLLDDDRRRWGNPVP